MIIKQSPNDFTSVDKVKQPVSSLGTGNWFLHNGLLFIKGKGKYDATGLDGDHYRFKQDYLVSPIDVKVTVF
jgi:hypothetical protein